MPSDLHNYWMDAGPGSADANALKHLRRYNFLIKKATIYPLKGYELNREDRMAIDYLVDEWDYEYEPAGHDGIEGN